MDKREVVVATVKSWNVENFDRIRQRLTDYNWQLITDKNDLTYGALHARDPKFVFLPHWSWIIPREIVDSFPCLVFHMTDLPFGRGGSPLQNLLVRGIYRTKVSALRASAELDAGPVYMKENLDISEGNADEILRRASDLSFSMMERILRENPEPKPQQGKVVKFERRTPSQSEIPAGLSVRQLYDYIRMLDGEGYPRAFLNIGSSRLELSQAHYNGRYLDASGLFSPPLNAVSPEIQAKDLRIVLTQQTYADKDHLAEARVRFRK